MRAGLLGKMKVEHGSPIQYTLHLGEPLLMNQLLGKEIHLEWSGRIVCSHCEKTTRNSFGQGFCYPCFMAAPQASPCIISPELCRAHEGTGRCSDMELLNHHQSHVVYLAVSDTIKVGVTRGDQYLTRWIDQGAHRAIILAETPNRYIAGTIEVALKSHVTDKTNWQRMLRNEVNSDIDLVEEKGNMEDLLPFDMRDFISDDDTIYEFDYPVLQFPAKVKSVSFDKQPRVSGRLAGIKGQYLIFEDQTVINLRKHTSYEIQLTYID